MKTLVIAEIGSAWRFGEDHLQNAYRAIGIAKDCGADVIKFQWCSDPRMMEKRRNVPEGSYDILAWLKLWIAMMHEKCELVGIEFLCTCFLPEDVAVLNPYVKRWKVASLERRAYDLLLVIAKTGKPVIASIGADDEDYSGYLRDSANQNSVLHCTVSYPAPLNELNLSAIRTNYFDGYSDHSRNVLTGALAVTCGAKIVEAHFKLGMTPNDNPDAGHSLWPEQLREYILNIRQAELMLGDGIKRIMPCEEWALKHKVKS